MNWFKSQLRKFIRSVATWADIRVYHPWTAIDTRHKLIFLDPPEIVKHNVPKDVYFNTASGNITIGRGVGFGEGVMLLTGKHMDIEESRSRGLPFHTVSLGGRDIVIEDGCFIASGAIIVGPCHIGAYSVICAGAIVRGRIEDRNVVAGPLAKPISVLKVD